MKMRAQAGAPLQGDAWVRLCCALLFAIGVPAFASGPVALVGGDYGVHGRNSLIKKVLLAGEIAYDDLGDTMDFSLENLTRYSLIVISHGSEALVGGQPEAAANVGEYVEAGGHVILIANAPSALCGPDVAAQQWIGMRQWAYQRAAPPATITGTDHPWLSHLTAGKPYFWLDWTHRMASPVGATVLIGEPTSAFLTLNETGKGWCVFISRGLFPYTANDVGPEREAQVELMRKIVMDASPLTVPEQVAAATAGWRDRRLLAWRRDWQFGSKEGPQFRPAFPAEDELLDRVTMDLTLGERESYAINLTPLGDDLDLTVQVGFLKPAQGRADSPPAVEVLVMDRAPLIPWDKPDLQPVESPFWLLNPAQVAPEGPAFAAPANRTRVLWLRAHAPARCTPGSYEGTVTVSAPGGFVRELPLSLRVWPIRSTGDRLFTFKLWGGGASDIRFCREFERQGICNAHLSYPDLSRVRLPEHDLSLSEAMKRRPELFVAERFPRLDFSYLDEYMDRQALHGMTDISFQDVRTGSLIANAATGLDVSYSTYDPAATLPAWRRAWVGYYRELMRYLRAKGFRRVEPLWTDEPSVETIAQHYVPAAEMYIEAGMAPGSHWTTPGFMTPEDVNRFAHAVSDWSMYSIMMPRFFGFLADGSVKLRPDAVIGQTRGGYGFAHRNPYANSRRLCWDAWHNGARFLRTGPVFKGWIYYANYEKSIRDEGVAGERLFAYSSSDPADLNAPLLSCPDIEATRDGADDASLVMALQWTVTELRRRQLAPADLLSRVEAEVAGLVGKDSPFNLHLEPKHYEVKDLKYDYTSTVDATPDDMARARRRVLELLVQLKPFASKIGPSITWSETTLATDGKAAGPISAGAGSVPEAEALAAWLNDTADVSFAVSSNLQPDMPGIRLLTMDDPALPALLQARGWALEPGMPRVGSYVILNDSSTVAIIGADAAGLAVGARAFRGWVSPRGHWICR